VQGLTVSIPREFKAIVQSEHGLPRKVLRIENCPLKTDEIGADEIIVKVTMRPIHRGDIHILSALPQGGPVQPIAPGTLRVPGFEGVGTIVRLGSDVKARESFREGERVAFFPVNGSWGEYVIANQHSLLLVPDSIRDEIAAQMLINTVTASVLIRAGHNSLKPPITPPVYILQNAAASGVGRLLTRIALDRGVVPIRLVRSEESAERLRSVFPGPPIYSTADCDWKKRVRNAVAGHRLEVAFDALGGKAIEELAEVLDDGGTVINFGSLESNTGINIYALAPNNVALKSLLIMSWFRLSQEERHQDLELALNLATKHPELFEVSGEYGFSDFQKAIQRVSSAHKAGIVLLKSPE
jgi:NADPH:quinone reductase-like Zn-dependent oxidoreductase